MMIPKRVILILFLFFFFQFCFAQFQIEVFPKVISEKVKPRDVLDYEIKIKNLGKDGYFFYTLVEELEESKERERNSSLLKWIEIFRGRSQLLPGEEKKIPLSIKIPPFAKSGEYFGTIIFAEGSNETDARERAKVYNFPKIFLNLEVQEHLVEKIQVKKFQTEKTLYFSPKTKFKIELENIGNKEVFPRGKIIIYNKRGQEVDSLSLPEVKIEPGKIHSFEISWKSFQWGNFKASLFGEYGENFEKIFQDTTFFGIFPWWFLLLIIFVCLLCSFLILWFLFKKLEKKFSFSRLRKFFDIKKE